MSDFIVSARKYRPATFRSVVGQKHITSTLQNAIERGQLAHAYLFCGPRGVGKTTCARIFAKAINCLAPHGAEACNECESCRSFNEGRSLNIHELDAASNNSVEDIRTLIEQVRIIPQVGRYSVFIIDEVHMLSAAAFNAFLKTLEEPPAHVIFILATTEPQKVLPTIISRCQRYDFSKVSQNEIMARVRSVLEQEHREENKGAEKRMDAKIASDETAVITAGMVITGDVSSEGSMDLVGTINGNIDILGKLNITGYINGNSKAAEIFAEGAKINGEIMSEGSVKIGASTVVIGNITATSAAIAGAVKGDIDVQGPVILDSSAIVMGNIKSKSVQINNGAVIEGMCSQCYAEVSPTSFFDDYKPEKKKTK